MVVHGQDMLNYLSNLKVCKDFMDGNIGIYPEKYRNGSIRNNNDKLTEIFSDSRNYTQTTMQCPHFTLCWYVGGEAVGGCDLSGLQ